MMKKILLLSMMSTIACEADSFTVEYYEVKTVRNFTAKEAKKFIDKKVLIPIKTFTGKFKKDKFEYKNTRQISVPIELSKNLDIEKSQIQIVGDSLSIKVVNLYDEKGKMVADKSYYIEYNFSDFKTMEYKDFPVPTPKFKTEKGQINFIYGGLGVASESLDKPMFVGWTQTHAIENDNLKKNGIKFFRVIINKT